MSIDFQGVVFMFQSHGTENISLRQHENIL